MMRRYLSLERDDLVIDPVLLERLPAGLAWYYLALPLACEDGVMSVAMVHPENTTALSVLGDLLGAPIVPVRVHPEALVKTLRRLYSDAPAPTPRVLCWSAQASELAKVADVAAAYAASLSGTVTVLSSSELNIDTALTVASKGHYNLAVLLPPSGQPLAPLLQHPSLPLLLLSGKELPMQRILIALRGYAADYYALDWLAPLLQPPATVTLLPLPHTPLQEAHPPLRHNGSGTSHLERCLRHPVLDPARTFVRFRQGLAAQQVVDELRQQAYDLLAITAEGYGQFVSDVLATTEAETVVGNRALFLLRPPAVGRT